MVLAIAENQGWEVHQSDVKSTFLNGICVKKSVWIYLSNLESMVQFTIYAKLKISLYGLKQVPRAWYVTWMHFSTIQAS